MSNLLPPFHRFVTGHLADGRSTHIRKDVIHTEPLKGSTIKDPMKVVFTTAETPADNSSEFVDPMSQTVASLANSSGTVVRYVDFLPHTTDVVRLLSAFRLTNSIDYGIVLQGSIWHSTEDGDWVEMKAGDIMVQRGTAHAWENRTDEYCRVVFVLVAAHPVEAAGKKLEEAGFHAKEFEQPADK